MSEKKTQGEEKLMNRNMQVSFSIHDHDRDGERTERGIYLHFGGTRLKVAENKGQLIALQKRLNTVMNEVIEDWEL